MPAKGYAKQNMSPRSPHTNCLAGQVSKRNEKEITINLRLTMTKFLEMCHQ